MHSYSDASQRRNDKIERTKEIHCRSLKAVKQQQLIISICHSNFDVVASAVHVYVRSIKTKAREKGKKKKRSRSPGNKCRSRPKILDARQKKNERKKRYAGNNAVRPIVAADFRPASLFSSPSFRPPPPKCRVADIARLNESGEREGTRGLWTKGGG